MKFPLKFILLLCFFVIVSTGSYNLSGADFKIDNLRYTNANIEDSGQTLNQVCYTVVSATTINVKGEAWCCVTIKVQGTHIKYFEPYTGTFQYLQVSQSGLVNFCSNVAQPIQSITIIKLDGTFETCPFTNPC